MNYVSRTNSDFEKSDFQSISNDHFKCLLFVCGLRKARYTDVRSRILKHIKEKQEISLQYLGDECVRMETIMSDNNMIQNKTEEYGYVRKIEESHIRKISLNNPRKENHHYLVGYVVICTLLEIVRVRKQSSLKEQSSCQSDKKQNNVNPPKA